MLKKLVMSLVVVTVLAGSGSAAFAASVKEPIYFKLAQGES
jgi:hypothetical protein